MVVGAGFGGGEEFYHGLRLLTTKHTKDTKTGRGIVAREYRE
jgi:hypothetical protein